jgi:hypothetical protein
LTLCQLIIMSSTKPKYVKLVEIALIKGLGSMEDEQLFSKLNFIKTKIHNWLTNHLDLFVHMFEQSIFSMDKFPFWWSNAHLVLWKISIWFKCLKFQAWALRWMGEVVNYHFLQALNFGPFPFVFIKNITNIFVINIWCATMGIVFEEWGSTPPP